MKHEMMINLCPHCGRKNELVTSTSNLKGEPGPPKIPEDGDFGICAECGEWHVFDMSAPGKTRVPNLEEYMTIGTGDMFRKIRAAWVSAKEAAKNPPKPKEPAPGERGRKLAKNHFHREFERIAAMGGPIDKMPPMMRAAIQGVFAVAVLGVFEEIDRARGLGLQEGTAYLAALKREAQAFATESGLDMLKEVSNKRE